MLNLINRYCHGYVSLPVLAALSRRGIFERLASQPTSLEALAKASGARPGHLRIALRLAYGLGQVTERLGLWSIEHSYSPFWEGTEEPLLPLYRTGSDVLDERSQDLPIRALKFVNRASTELHDLERGLIDGSLVLSLLLPLKLRGAALDLPLSEALDLCAEELKDEFQEWVQSRGWVSDGGKVTQAGEMLWERLLNCGVVASYRPLLAQIDEVLFGNPKLVFDRSADGHESHLDRTLNVVGSGFQHTRYFREVEDLIIPLFNTQDTESQPKYIADMGCGDGTFLRHLYQTICSKSRRGALLEQYPLTLLAIDFNEAALEASRKTLEGLPAQFLHGDIGDPQGLLNTFAAQGISDYQNILHVRSFLDHDRPFLALERPEETVRRDVFDLDGAYVTPEGEVRPVELVLQNMVEHLRRWHSVLGPHGMIMLEVHSLRPQVIRRWLDSCENLSFDATQSFSGQLLMEAHEVLAASAEAGLFPRPESTKCFPRTLPYTRITLNHLDARRYRIRNAYAEDVSALFLLEEAWPSHLRLTRETIERRLTLPGNRVFVVEYEDAVVAALYTQRISSVEVLATVQYDELERISDTSGTILQFIGLSADKSYQHHGFGNILRNFVLTWARLHPEIELAVGITRCGKFTGSTLEDLQRYLANRDEAGIVLDPIVRFHHLHGAEIQGLAPDYRPADVENLGCGVLISYSLSEQVVMGSEEAHDGNGRDASALIRSLLKSDWTSLFDKAVPLRDLGFDSLDLLELRLAIEKSYKVALDDTFFFRATTASEIEQALKTLTEPAATITREKRTFGRQGKPLAQQREEEAQRDREPLAVVGMACRFPGAASVEDLWKLLCEERSAISTLPDERRPLWEPALRDASPEIARTIRRGGFIDEVDRFDHGFFRISPKEARSMDPQQRLLLETVWHALESSGCNPLTLAETRTGTYVGSYTSDYRTIFQLHSQDDDAVTYYATGTDSSLIAGRVAYSLGLRGPALTINTACSSSLTALEIACSHLRAGSIDTALVGATNLMLTPELSVTFAKAGMLSPDGQCRTFDASANGYVRAEGIAAVVVKRLSDAYAAGDTIHGVIRGIAVNQDGASNGITAPNADAQEQLLRASLHDADLSPEDIAYLEAHGTGTYLGDPIEVEAISRVYGMRGSSEGSLLLSSVKANIGHTEATAGLAGLIKAILTLRHRYLPGLCHFKQENPALRLAEGKIAVAAHPFSWNSDTKRVLRVGVSSFGFSGTNAHVIVEEAVPQEVHAAKDLPKNELLLVSAKSLEALDSLTRRYSSLLAGHPENSAISDVCYTSQRGRALLPYRKVVEGASATELIEALQTAQFTEVRETRAPVYLFTGQGSQYVGMGRGLYEYEPVFREAVDECAEALRDELQVNLLEVLFGTHEEVRKRINETQYTQPTLFALQYGLVRMWETYGVRPAAVIGHSIGEFAAAYQAGIFSFSDAIRLVAARGRLMQDLPAGGAMVAVEADELTVRQEIAHCAAVAIAAVNGARSIVVSGAALEIAPLVESWRSRSVRVHELTVSHAFHSPLMRPMLEAFAKVAATVSYSVPSTPYYSSVLGREVSTEVADADYWIRQIHQPVLFYPALQRLAAKEAHQLMLELGPRPLLCTLGERAEYAGTLHSPISRIWTTTLGSKLEDMQSVQHAVAALVRHGVEIDWEIYTCRRRGSLTDLPRYPFDRSTSHWLSVPGASRDTPCAQYEVEWRAVDSSRGDKWPESFLLVGEQEEDLGELVQSFRAADLRCHCVRLSEIGEEGLPNIDAVALVLNSRRWSLSDLLQDAHSLIESVQRVLSEEKLSGLPLWGMVRETPDNLLSISGYEAFWRVLHTEYPQRRAPLVRLESGNTLTATQLQQAVGFTSVRIGSTGVTTPELVRVSPAKGSVKPLLLRADAYYLVTGATGAVGRALAERLIECGARQFILCSRSGLSPELRKSLERGGALVVRDERLDVADSAAVHAFISKLREERVPLDGVFHTAGQVADSLINQITSSQIETTLKAKVCGALSLHEATRDLPLSYFVCISSTAALFGTAGQAIYAAANGMLDGLCWSRVEQGLPALSFQLGHWNGLSGMASRLPPDVRTNITEQGIRFLEPVEALDVLVQSLAERRSVSCAAAVAWDQYQRAHHETVVPSVLCGLIPQLAEVRSNSTGVDARLATLASLPEVQRREALTHLLQGVVQTLLGSTELPEQKTGFFDLGFDSHLTLRFRDELRKLSQVNVPPTFLFEYPTIEQLVSALEQWLWKKESNPDITPRTSHSKDHSKAIAIVGMGCRLPGEIASSRELLSFLHHGGCAVSEIPAERWEGTLDGNVGLVTTTRGAFLDKVFEFDAPFFGISPREALHLDPQQRLLLEVTWETLEDAGLPTTSLPRTRTGVFVGLGQHDYARRGLYNGELEEISAYDGTGALGCFAPGRLAHYLGVEGPVLAVDTACSSSLVALHLAVQSLRNGEVDVALAGGVHLVLAPEVTLFLSRIGALSPSGRCRAFDRAADGYGRGEGCGVVALMRLDDALASGRRIHGLVVGSAVNHDGASSGLTVPNPQAQKRLYQAALEDAGLSPRAVAFVEAHGTGTSLGDPIEARSLAEVYGVADRQAPLVIGSLKNNIGHLEAAAGVAGLLKVVCALKEREIPGHLYDKCAPLIEEQDLALALPHRWEKYPESQDGLYAGVSSFGMSGTNAHVIVAEPPPSIADSYNLDESEGSVLLLSAASSRSLALLVQDYIDFLNVCSRKSLSWSLVCAAAAHHRVHHRERLAVVANSAEEAAQLLAAYARGEEATGVFPGRASGESWQIEFGKDSVTLSDLTPHLVAARELQATTSLWQGVAELYARGATFTWSELWPTPPVIDLPLYRFDRKRYVLPLRRSERAVQTRNLGMLDQQIDIPSLATTIYEVSVSQGRFPYLADHTIYGSIVVPGAFYLAALVAALESQRQGRTLVCRDVVFMKVLVLEHQVKRTLQIHLKREEESELSCTFLSFAPGSNKEWIEHAKARVSLEIVTSELSVRAQDDTAVASTNGAQFYQTMAERGIVLGSSFQWLKSLAVGSSTTESTLAPPPEVRLANQPLFPSLIDSCFQAMLCNIPPSRGVFVPLSIERFTYYAPHQNGQLRLMLNHQESMRPELVVADLQVQTESGSSLFDMQGVTCAHAAAEQLSRLNAEARSAAYVYDTAWEAVAFPQSIKKDAQILYLKSHANDNEIVAQLVRNGAKVQEVEATFSESGQVSFDLTQSSEWGKLFEASNFSFDIIAVSSPAKIDRTDLAVQAIRQATIAGALFSALVSSPASFTPRLWCLAAAVEADGMPVLANPAAEVLRGISRVAAHEQAQRLMSCLLYKAEEVSPFEEIAQILLSDLDETELFVKRSHVVAPRLVRSSLQSTVLSINPQETILVTGGFGALGKGVVDELVRLGATHFVIVSRRIPGDEETRYLNDLHGRGIQVRVCRGDIADSVQILPLMRDALHGFPKLGGIIHAAGVVKDTMLHSVSIEQINHVFGPKVAGVLALHALTTELPVRFFISFGSSAAVVGSLGQGIYAAANAFLEGVTNLRRLAGLPATILHWGPWDRGMTSSLTARDRERYQEYGLGTIPGEEGFALFSRLLSVEGTRCIQPFLVDQLTASCAGRTVPSLLRGIVSPAPRAVVVAQAQPPVLLTLSGAKRRQLILEIVTEGVKDVLGLDDENTPDAEQAFSQLGMDSLMALELRDLLQQRCGVSLPTTVAFQYPTIREMAQYLEGCFPQEQRLAEKIERIEVSPANEELDALSEDELAELLRQELTESEGGL